MTAVIQKPDEQSYEMEQPEKISGRYFRLSPSFLRYSSIGLSFIYYVHAKTLNSTLTLGLIICFCASIAYPKIDGRTYQTLAHAVSSFWNDLIKHHKYWISRAQRLMKTKKIIELEAVAVRQGIIPVSKPEQVQVNSRRLLDRVPSLNRPFPLAVNGFGDIAVVHNVINGTDALVLTGEGSSISSLDIKGQFNALMRISSCFKEVSAQQDVGIGVSLIFRRIPPDMYMVADNIKRVSLPEALLPAALEKPEHEHTAHDKAMLHAHQTILEMAEAQRDYSNDVDMAAVFTIKRQKPLTTATGQLPIQEIVDTAKAGLAAAGVQGIKMLNATEAEIYVRGGWDVNNLQEYYRLLKTGEEAANHELHWPQRHVLSYRDHCVMDGTYLSTVCVTKLPKFVQPNYFRQLHGGSTSARFVSYALVGKVMTSRYEYETLMRSDNMFQDVSKMLNFKENDRSKERRRRRQERTTRTYQQAFGQDYLLLVGVASPDKETLNTDVRSIRSMLKLYGMKGTRVKGSKLQPNASLTARTGFDLL